MEDFYTFVMMFGTATIALSVLILAALAAIDFIDRRNYQGAPFKMGHWYYKTEKERDEIS